MQCGCPECGILMSLQTRGIESKCVCPNCLYSCSACLGTKSTLSAEEIRNNAKLTGGYGFDASFGFNSRPGFDFFDEEDI